MTVIDDFENLLADFNRVEERSFLNNILDFAKKHKDLVIKTYAMLLKEKDINLQLKYLVLKSMGELQYREFIPIVQDLLKQEDKIQIIYEAVNTLVRINTLPTYKAIVQFLKGNSEANFKMQVEESLREFFSRNQLIYHFDVFYRNRGDVRGVEKSSEFLIKHLPDEYIKDILPALSSRFYKIRYEALQVLKHRPNPMHYKPIYSYFKANADKVDDRLFLLLSEALVVNACQSKLCHKIFCALREYLENLDPGKQMIFSIMLLKLNTPEMIDEVTAIYPKLDFEGKMLVFEHLNREDYNCYLDFIRQLLVKENSDNMLAKVIEILIYAKDFDYIFRVLKEERMLRREMLMGILLEFDPPELHGYVKEFVHASQSDRIVYLSLEYLLRHAADDYYDLIKSVFFSGVSYEIKTLIIRNIIRLSSFNRKLFMESVFNDLKVVEHFKKDFLFSLLAVLNEKKFDEQFEGMILNRILIIMEEAEIDEMVNFIYFFDKYEVNSIRDMELIIDELRLIQNTILKSGHKGDLVRMLHLLIKSIEKRTKLKGVPAE